MNKAFSKLILFLQEWIPARSRIFFIYTHKNGFDRFHNGLKANTEISYWCFTALEKAFPSVRFLRYQGEKKARIARIRPQDIVIGHIGPTFEQAACHTKRLIAFNPWAGHEDRSKNAFNCAPHEQEMALFDQCCSLILLTSEYNKIEYFEKERNFWYPYFQKFQLHKRVRLVHQPIDLNRFERIKWDYCTHDFLYIGNKAHMKCVDAAVALVQAAHRNLTTFGFDGKSLNHLDQEQIHRLPHIADFFIQPGMWEAQCVSILESAARGFIPIVSPETGYPYSHPFLLKYDDFTYNLKTIKKLLQTTQDERKILADTLHQQLVNDIHHNSWEELTRVLVEEVRELYLQNIDI